MKIASELISIITPSLNRAGMIQTAVESVLAQNHPNMEHIIIDGGSSDGTLDILAKYPHLQVVSGRDSGMYAALNRGLGLAKGGIIAFLNTDDEYLPGALSRISSAFEEFDADALAGQAQMLGLGQDQVVTLNQYMDPFDTILMGVPIFNAWFFRAGVFNQLGSFDTSFRIAGDREFLIRFSLAGLRVQLLEQVVYRYHQHGDSLTLSRHGSQLFPMLEEHVKIYDHFSSILSPGDSRQEKFRRWLRRDSLEACVQAIKSRNPSLLLKKIRLGQRFDDHFMKSLFLRFFARFTNAASN
jgi:glycosyltransferase involved in cell wall biosynthesis